jgi:hypothetical protein
MILAKKLMLGTMFGIAIYLIGLNTWFSVCCGGLLGIWGIILGTHWDEATKEIETLRAGDSGER